MSDEELIARLRDLGDHAAFEPHMHHVAADRIEALTEQLAAAQHDAKEAEAYAEEVERELRDTQDRANAFATKEYYTEMRAERAEAKLAKAVEEAEKYKHAFSAQSRKLQAVLHIEGVKATLAEIKGKSHE